MNGMLVFTFLYILLTPLLLGRYLYGFHRPGSSARRWYAGALLLGLAANLCISLNWPIWITHILAGLALIPILLKKTIQRLPPKNRIGIQWKRRCPDRASLFPLSLSSVTKMIAGAAILILILDSMFQVLNQPVQSWDAVAIWFNKARTLAAGGSFHSIPLPNYPNLGPSLWALALTILPGFEPAGRLFFPLFFVAFVMAIHEFMIKDHVPGGVAAIVTVFIAYLFFDGSMISGYQDSFLMTTLGMGMLELFETFGSNRTNAPASVQPSRIAKGLLLSAFYFGCAALIKNEGLIHGLILLIAISLTAIYMHIKHKAFVPPRAALPALVLLLSLLFAWPTILSLHGFDATKVQSIAFTPASVLSAWKNIDRLDVIRPYASAYLIQHIYHFAASFIAVIVIWVSAPKYRAITAVASLYYIGHGAFVFLVFLSTRQNLEWHLATAYERLMYQHTHVFIIIPIVALAANAHRVARALESLMARIHAHIHHSG